MPTKLCAAVAVLASLACAGPMKSDWNASPLPVTINHCARDLQKVTIDSQRAISYAPTLASDPLFAKLTSEELDDLKVLLRSPEYGAVMVPFRSKKTSLVCSTTGFVRVQHPNAWFDVPLDSGPPGPLAVVLRLLQRLRDAHFGTEFDPLQPGSRP